MSRQPYLKLMQGDCLELLAGLPAGCIDAVITDPPFGVTNIGWDSVIPLEEMWAALHRVIKPRAPVVLFGVQPFTARLICSNLKDFRYAWVWQKNKPGGFSQSKNKPMASHEEISVFSSGRTGHVGQCVNRMPYFPQGLKPYGKTVNNSRAHRASAFESRPSHKDSYVREFTGYPGSVLAFDVERTGVHPTQKPVPLMEYLITTYTQPGETVLDFTMGSGTTGVAAMATGRRFIGIEKDVNYFSLAAARIKEARAKTLREVQNAKNAV